MITENNINIELEKLFDNILRKSSIRPPIEVGKNNDLISDFHSKCEKFKDCLKEYLTNNDKILAHRVRSRLKVIQSLQDGIINCLECFLTGDIKSAYDCFELMLKPQFISRHIKNICIPLTEMCNSQRPLFRVRKSDRPYPQEKIYSIFHLTNAIWLGAAILSCRITMSVSWHIFIYMLA